MDILALIPQIVSVFGVSFLSLWGAVPVGLALGLSPVLIIATITISYISGVVLVVLLGEPIRQRILQRFGGKTTQTREGVVWRVWDRFGVIGLGLIAPITIGAQIGTILALSLGVERRPLVLWMSIGALVWSVFFTVSAVAGIMGVQSVTQ